MITFALLPHAEAVARTAGLPLVTREVMEGLLPELRAYAFCISGVDAFDQLARARDLIAAVPAGTKTWDQAKTAIAAELEGALGEGAERRAELLLRTHTFRGYAASRYRTLMAQREVFPLWQYSTHGDGNVRPSHAALNGKIFPAGHPIWQRIFPPWDWGCRCLVVPITQEDLDPDEQERLKAARDAEETLLPGQRYSSNVYTEAEATAMHAAGRLYLPNGQTVSLMPSQTWGDSPWSVPGTVQHTWAMIRERYAKDPEVLAAFEAWARATVIEGNLTVADWLSGSAVKIKKAVKKAKKAAKKDTFPVRKLGGSTKDSA